MNLIHSKNDFLPFETYHTEPYSYSQATQTTYSTEETIMFVATVFTITFVMLAWVAYEDLNLGDHASTFKA